MHKQWTHRNLIITRVQFITLVWCLLMLNGPVNAQEEETSQRPKVGLVLSGGAAKGIAHIGVLKVLEEINMPIDYIGGTSMGSIVGGLYAAGYSADSLTTIIQSLDWNYVLSDQIPRRQMTMHDKVDEDRFLISFPIKRKNGLSLPEGLIRGQHVESTFSELCIPVSHITDFNELPIPFLCVAVDTDSGEEKVFQSGVLAQAMRASMSIPSAFEPMLVDGKRYLDGGLINNFPVLHVKEMGADIIIGVDVGHKSQPGQKTSNLLSVMEEAVFLYSAKVNEENKKAVDIYINPDLKGLGLSSFAEGDSLVLYGETAARNQYKRLKTLADSLNRLEAYQPVNRAHLKNDSIFLTRIIIEGDNNQLSRQIQSRLDLEVLTWVQAKDITGAMNNLYASMFYNKVAYILRPADNGSELVIKLQERSDGALRFGFYYDNDYKASLFVNTTFRNLLLNNSRLSLTAGLGRSPSIDFLYQIDKRAIPAPGLRIKSNWIEVYEYAENRKKIISEYYSQFSSQLFLQSNVVNLGSFRFGGEYQLTTINPDVSFIDFPSFRDQFFGVFGWLQFDTYDRPFYPLRGQYSSIKARYMDGSNTPPFLNISAQIKSAIKTTKRLTIRPQIYGGVAIGDSIPVQNQYWFGGMSEIDWVGNIPFAGYKFMEIPTNTTVMARLDLDYEIVKNLFFSLMMNGALIGENLNDMMGLDHYISGYGFSLGLVTPLGPIRAMISRAGELQQFIGFIQLGYWF